jgi:hypothetical protein
MMLGGQFRFIAMLLRGLIRPKGLWPIGLFRALPAHVLQAAQGTRPLSADAAEDISDTAPDASEADAYYCARFRFAGETVTAPPEELFVLTRPSIPWQRERDGLAWLKHFCAAPRRLHIFYLARLMDGWMTASIPTRNMHAESERLNNLAETLPLLGRDSGAREQAIFKNALEMQCARLLQLKPHSPEESVEQAASLLSLARRDDRFGRLVEGAWKQLAVSLPQLILADGSDICRDADRAMGLAGTVAKLLEGNGSGAVPPAVMVARDKLLAYLAMFRLGPGLWSSAVSGDVPAHLEALFESIHPISHAPLGGRTLLQQAETRILVHWGEDFRDGYAEIAHMGKPVLFVHQAKDAPPAEPQPSRHEAGSGEGDLLCASWVGQETCLDKTFYLSTGGKDMRFEECWRGGHGPAGIVIRLQPNCKILRMQDGLSANIYLPDGSGWQLKVRGARISREGTGSSLWISGPGREEGCIQWALKKHPSSRPRGGRSQKRTEQDSELPF